MQKNTIIPVMPTITKEAIITKADYQRMYTQSITEPDTFWAEQANKFLSWYSPWTKVTDGDFYDLKVRWFVGATLNACYNCLDRHLPERADQVALLWEGDDPQSSRRVTYQALYDEVCRCANVLKKFGIQKGDRVCIYMPMIPEAVVAMLACARIGAIHSVVFGGFSPEALRDRIQDTDCELVITADSGMRGNKNIPLKNNVTTALKECPKVRTVIVVRHTGTEITWHPKTDVWYHTALAEVDKECPPTPMDAEDPLFILYTSGSTGTPKGILHTTAGYLLYNAMTFRYVFDYHEGEIFWCTADIGWVTGHSYIVYGPLCNGATVVLFEGVPNYPSFARFWQVIDKYKVNIFYTAPTAIRALRREGDSYVQSCDRQSLRILGTVGEPINPDVWEWYYRVVGNSRCPIVDTWWQTETGGIMISALPGATDLKPGAATLPFFGISPAIVDDTGKILTGACKGKLVITQPWPGMLRTIYHNPARFAAAYFNMIPGMYLTGDGAKRDEDGYYWITGRIDDVMNVSGHRIGTAEVESAILRHPAVSEAAVVGVPHEIKGEGIYAYVTLKQGYEGSAALKEELLAEVTLVIGAFAKPDVIQWSKALPKTRSGKIMRRLCRKIASGETKDLGDISTLAEPDVVANLIKENAQQCNRAG